MWQFIVANECGVAKFGEEISQLIRTSCSSSQTALPKLGKLVKRCFHIDISLLELVFEEATRLQCLQAAHVSTVPCLRDPNFVQNKPSYRGAARGRIESERS